MAMADQIAAMIKQLLEQTDDGIAEIRRNVLASEIGCVPSQINYVISSRFTPEHGYLVESRRGGGGYVRITRVNYQDRTMMHIINSIGERIDERSASVFLDNMQASGMISGREAKIIKAALSERSYSPNVAPAQRDALRAEILKHILVGLA